MKSNRLALYMAAVGVVLPGDHIHFEAKIAKTTADELQAADKARFAAQAKRERKMRRRAAK